MTKSLRSFQYNNHLEYYVYQVEKQVVELVNNERIRNDLHPLVVHLKLSEIARAKSEDMYINKYFSHNSPTFGCPFDMLKIFGVEYSCAAENIAKGQKNALGVVHSWINSAGHRKNILGREYTETGVGLADIKGIPIWTQIFIRS